MDEEEVIKLAVHVAENGQFFELNCPASASVQVLQTCIASIVRVPPQNQLLLCDTVRLEPQRTLASYKLPPEGRNVFLFNRPRLFPAAAPPEPEILSVKELVVPSPPVHSHGSDKEHLQNIDDALQYYKSQFEYHFEKGHALFSVIHDKFDFCQRLVREQQVQQAALMAAKGNVSHFNRMIDNMYGEFIKSYSRSHQLQADILMNFDRDLNELRKYRLHPHLVSGNRQTLLDCIDEAGLLKQVEYCTNSRNQFNEKVVQLKAAHLELNQKVQDLLDGKVPVDIRKLEHLVTQNAPLVEEQRTILQSLSKDVATLKKLAENYMGRRATDSLKPCDMVSGLPPMNDVHDKDQLPRMEGCHQKMEKLLDFFRRKKHDMSVCLHTNMQKVAALQANTRDMHYQLTAMKEALIHQDALFSDLKLVNRIGPAYRACLAEVVRRKASMKLYMGLAGQLAEKMAKKRAAEVAARDEFLRVQSAVIPRDVLCCMGLLESPSPCIVNIEPYDTQLLDIDIKDLDEYAPLVSFGSNQQISDSQPYEEKGSVNDELEVIENDEISGTSNFEVENAWLKAELAGAIALLCNIDPNYFHKFSLDESESQEIDAGSLAVKKTIEALALKDNHAKYLEDQLSASRSQCNSYEKRIRELEKQLSDQYNAVHVGSKESQTMMSKSEVSEVTGEVRNHGTIAASEPMDDDLSSSTIVFDRKVVDDHKDIVEPTKEETNDSMADLMSGFSTGMLTSLTPFQSQDSAIVLEKETAGCMEIKDDVLAKLREVFLQKENQCTAMEKKLEEILGERENLKEDLENKIKILNECYMNCAELESNLLQAREEARTNKCLADRKAAEYSALRASSVKLRGLVERLRYCVFTSTDLVESLQAFANSLNSKDNTDDVTQEFGKCMKSLSDRIQALSCRDNFSKQ